MLVPARNFDKPHTTRAQKKTNPGGSTESSVTKRQKKILWAGGDGIFYQLKGMWTGEHRDVSFFDCSGERLEQSIY